MAQMNTTYGPTAVTTSVSGGDGNIPGLEEFLAQMLRIKAQKAPVAQAGPTKVRNRMQEELDSIALRRAQRQEGLEKQQAPQEAQARAMALEEQRMKMTAPRKVFVPGYGGHYEEALTDLPLYMRPGTTNVIPAEDPGDRANRKDAEEAEIEERRANAQRAKQWALVEMIGGTSRAQW